MNQTISIKDLRDKVVGNRKSTEPLFMTIFKNRMERTKVHYGFKDVCKELGISENAYSWRKTFGYHYYKKYGDIVFLNWFFGHNTVEQTFEYINAEESISARYQGSVGL